MARQALPQAQRLVESEDFSSQIGAIASDDDEDGDEGGSGSYAPADPLSSVFVVPDPPYIEVPPPGSTASAFRQVSRSLASPYTLTDLHSRRR